MTLYKGSEIVQFLRLHNFQVNENKPFKNLDPMFILHSLHFVNLQKFSQNHFKKGIFRYCKIFEL